MPRMLAIAVWMTPLATLGFAQLVSYDADSLFPEETGDEWVVEFTLFPAERWLSNGHLFQAPIVLTCPPECTTRDFYSRGLQDQAGTENWFLTWKMMTDGPQAFGAVAPAAIVAGGTSGVFYHFVIARDRMRLLRDTQFPLVFADIEEGVPHVYRLEHHNSPPPATYVFTIDGVVIDEGEAEGAYPTEVSRITFGARAAIKDSITQWDYVRFGRIPDPGSGDMDSDGEITLEDFRFFDECFAEGGPGTEARAGCLFADMDADGDVDFHDFAAFQIAFTGAG